jgi:superfamily II DNA or RNA helicase
LSQPERQTTFEQFIPPAFSLPHFVPVSYPRLFPSGSASTLNFPPLHEIQQEAVKAFLALPTPRHGLISAPVGSGKTILAIKLWDLLGRPNMLIVVPRIVSITNPWLKEIEKLGIDPRSIGQYYSEEKEIRLPITVTIYNTLVIHPEMMSRFQFVVFDEADVLAGDAFSGILDYIQPIPNVVGLTGTIREAYQRSPKLKNRLPPIFERTIREAREQRLLAPAEIIPVEVELLPEERAEYERLSETFRRYMAQSRQQFDPRERNRLERMAFMVNQKRLILLSNAENKQDEVARIILTAPEVPTLVFSSSVLNVQNLQNRLAQAGIKSEAITADTPREERQRIISDFGTKFKVLLSVGVLARGYNVPEVSREIFMGATSTSLTAVEQRLGRALRRDPANPSKVAQIYAVVAARTIDMEMLGRLREAYNRIRRVG